MRFSLAERAAFYDELGKFVAAGFPYRQAIATMLSAHPSGATRRVLQKLATGASANGNLTGGISALDMPFDRMELSVLKACEISGKIPQGCEWLSQYFRRQLKMRRQIWKRSAYPLCLLHLGVVSMALPKLFRGELALLKDVFQPLMVFYLLAAAVWIFAFSILALAENSVAMDRTLGVLPLIGDIRRSLAVVRFCTSYVMQMDSGVNVMDSLVSAGDASNSASLRKAVATAIPAVRLGRPVGPELAATGAFSPAILRALILGEQTGTLDENLDQVAQEADLRVSAGLDLIGEWLPRLLYFTIVGVIAYQLVANFKESLGGLDKMME